MQDVKILNEYIAQQKKRIEDLEHENLILKTKLKFFEEASGGKYIPKTFLVD